MRMVLIEDLEQGMELAQDVYESADSVSPISRKGIILTDYLINRMKKLGIRTAYVETTKNSGDKSLEQNFTPRGKRSPTLNKALRKDALSTIENMFEVASISQDDIHASSAQIITSVDSVVHKLMDSLLTEQDTLVNIHDLKSYDDYTYHHSLSVAVLSLAIGQYMGYNNEQLNRLGICAMMHDIGKTAIPLEIIRKPERLDDNEFRLIKTHSTAGYQYLTKSSIGDETLWLAVLHHHEKFDGSGYPNGLHGNDIPEWSRIISVADVYDALTSNRPYRKPMQPSDAIEYIMGGSGSAFDFDIVYALVKKIDLYPIGSEIELSDGRFAEVLDNDCQNRPIVRITDTEQILDLYRDRQCLNLVVKRVVSLPPVY